MKTKLSKIFTMLVVMVMILTTFAGCAKKEEAADTTATTTEATTADSTSTEGATTETAKTYDKFITVDVFASQANYQGIQSGWFAKVVKDKFNMELNIIAPNVAGGGDTLFQTRSAAGDLGDIVMIGSENGRLSDTVNAGLLLKLDDYITSRPNLAKYTKALDNMKAVGATDGYYAIPSAVSEQPATNPSEGLDLTFGPYLRWDYYQGVGAPTINTLEDMLPVLKAMQDKYPTSDSGKKTYAFSLFKDWDGNMMMEGKQPACFYGYDELGFVFAKADGSDYQSIIDTNSAYVRNLKLYFNANQMGLLDPESTTQNWDSVFAKYQDGAVLFSPWPWLGQAAYNTTTNKEAGKGFMLVPIQDMKIFSYGATPSGAKYVVGIGAKAEDPERMADFLDWLYSPEGVMMSCAQTSGSCGPEGLTWEMKDGRPVLTDFGKQAFLSGDAEMPAEWGGGTWKDGTSQLNFTTVLTSDINPISNAAYNYTLWDSVIEANTTPLDKSWQDAMSAKTTLDYLTQHNAFVVAPGSPYVAPAEDAEISTLRSQCKSIIVETSWKMVFAKDEAEFNSLLADMQETVKGLGYDQVLEYDMKIAKEQNDARVAAAAK